MRNKTTDYILLSLKLTFTPKIPYVYGRICVVVYLWSIKKNLRQFVCSKLKHENIVKLIGYAVEEQRLYVIMELTSQSMDTCIAAKQVQNNA